MGFRGKFALILGVAMLSGCGPIMAYDRMRQYNAVSADHDALAACLQTSNDCSKERELYTADQGAGSAFTHGNSRLYSF